MDPDQNKNGAGQKSWSIPKKKSNPPAQQHQEQRRPSLEGSIPRRKSGSSNPSSHSMIIPRKQKHPHPPTSSSGNGFGSSSSSSTIRRKTSFTGAIPRRQSSSSSGKKDGAASSSSASRPPPPSLHGAIPRRKSGSSSYSSHSTTTHGHGHKSNGRPGHSGGGRDTPNRPTGHHKRLSFKIPASSSSQRDEQTKAHLQKASQSQASSQPFSLGPNVLSERPFRISIDLKGVDLSNSEGIPRTSRTPPPARVAPTALKPERERKQTKTNEYKELDDTDSDEFFTDSEDDDYGSRNKKKKTISKKPKVKKPSSSLNLTAATSYSANSKVAAAAAAAVTASGISAYQQIPYLGPSVANVGALPATAWLELGNNSFESPPTGAVASLWYSREVFLNTHVVEKILAWRTRPMTQLEWDPESYSEDTKPVMTTPVIDSTKAAKYSEMARSCPMIWRDPKKRTEVSRIEQEQCPIVMAMAAEAEQKYILEEQEQRQRREQQQQAPQNTLSTDNGAVAMDIEKSNNKVTKDHQMELQQQQGKAIQNGQQEQQQQQQQPNDVEEVPSEQQKQENSTTKTTSIPRYRIKQTPATGEIDREEVYLVKWRGKSYLHASWERGSDIIRRDQTNNTARSKIRKYIQAQELAYGLKWKRVLEEERNNTAATNTNIHAHGADSTEAKADAATAVVAPEEVFENEEYYPRANTEVGRILACDESEMDLSLYPKQRALDILDEHEQIKQRENGTIKRWNSKEGLKELLTEPPWDPEDNVRYIVKWKGLPFAEMTWEYWKDIKTDAADEVEDFWIRQIPPDDETLIKNMQPHPHMQDFRKIQESPSYGLSKKSRLVAESVNGRSVPKEDEDDSANPNFRLRNYQLEGVNWLLFNWWNRRSCILADEMGLGKTIQSVGFIKLLQDLPTTGVRGPYLIVAPLSLIGQWQSETKTWAPDLNVVLYHGSADARDFLVKNDFFFTDQFVSKATANKLRKQHVTKFHILITTYEVVLKDVDVFTKIKWKTLIVDEAHRLKNSNSKLFEELSSVPRDYCILLTGTPLANATEELWALLKFANGSIFDSKEDFLEKFGQLTDSDQVNQLHAVLKPYLLRRVKEDVEKSMPPKTETILEVSLTPSQKKFYKAIYERNTSFLFKGAKPKNSPSLMNVMMELRKCCNHPFLIRGAEDKILLEAAEQIRTNDPDAELDYVKIFHDQLVRSSGKMVLIHKVSNLFSYRLLR